MKYSSVTLNAHSEILIALLSSLPFDSFLEEEENNEIIGYIKSAELTESTLLRLGDICNDYSVSYHIEELPEKNWNEEWESSFLPVEIDDYCRIRASFHSRVDGYKHEIIIDPKMAFGTGHHETTFMMIQELSKHELSDKSVLDYGCGTGILAILCAQEGGHPILAIDIEKDSVENTETNLKENNIGSVQVEKGDLEVVPSDQKYNFILANINRHVLLNNVEALYKLLQDQGRLIMSGILKQDRNIIQENYTAKWFDIVHESARGNWLCMTLSKKNP